MALVSEGLGLKQAESTSTFLKQIAILLAQAIKDGKKKGYLDEHMQGAKAILKHINHGKQTSYQLVDTRDAALFEKLLQNRRVPYVRLQDMNGKTLQKTTHTHVTPPCAAFGYNIIKSLKCDGFYVIL